MFSELINQFTSEPIRQITPLQGAGSNRKYYRITTASNTYIGVKGTSIEENRAFITLSRWFGTKNLNVPEIHAVSKDGTTYIQSDLGSFSLYDLIHSDRAPQEVYDILNKVVVYLPKIQYEGAAGLNFSCCYPQEEFNKETVLWDLNYFKYYFLKPTIEDFDEAQLERSFAGFADLLQSFCGSNTFMYRDFQSRNILIDAQGEPYFIDYQGGRKGPAQYDIVSFLWQAKANLPEEWRERLLSNYITELKRYQNIDEAYFKESIGYFVLFRTLQVLGAYGFRGYFERKTHFLQSIPFALRNLSDLLSGSHFSSHKELNYLVDLLKQLIADKKEIKRGSERNEPRTLTIRIFSFSYRIGVPYDPSGNGGGSVFDCRHLHNPGRYEPYKQLTGLDPEVKEFLEKEGEVTVFLKHVKEIADAAVTKYMERGFTDLMFSFGCTGGQHRSVYSAQHLADYLSSKYDVRVELTHTNPIFSK